MTDKSELCHQIRYLQIETGTVCNYNCVYCPVAYHPRKGSFMHLDLVKKIVDDLALFPNIKQIFLNGYDEPTLNPHLASVVAMFAHIPAKITLLTNGTRLTPKLANDLVNTGANIEFDIHLAAVNPHDFQRVHNSKLFEKVMNNIEYLKTLDQLGRVEVHISTQGLKNERDNRIFQEIQSYFSNTPFKIHKWFPNDRGGILKNEYSLNIYHKKLKGCSLENRPQQWIHINANGKAILCCQDYFEEHIIGDVSQQSLLEIVDSKELRLYRQWTEGEVDSPKDYICRKCMFANSDEISSELTGDYYSG